MLEMVHMAGGVPHDFLGHATNIDAGTAQRPGLDNRDSRTILGRAPRMGDATAATTNDYKIKLFGQTFFSNRASALVGAPFEARLSNPQVALRGALLRCFTAPSLC